MNTYFATSHLTSMRPLSAQGIIVTDCYSQLKDFFTQNQDFLAENGMPNAPSFLAEPVKDENTGLVDWYVDSMTIPTCLSSLSKPEQCAVSDKIAAYAAALNALIQSEAGQRYPQMVEVLLCAMKHPSADDIYVVNGNPVLINWGFAPEQQETDPENVMFLYGGSIAMQAAASADMTEPAEEEEPEDAGAEEESGDGNDAEEPEDADAEEKSEDGNDEEEPEDGNDEKESEDADEDDVVVEHKTGCLPWLLPILLLLALLWLLIASLGLVPSPLPKGLFKEDVALESEVQRSERLINEAAALYSKLIEQYALCIPSPKEKTAPKPAVPAAPGQTTEQTPADTARPDGAGSDADAAHNTQPEANPVIVPDSKDDRAPIVVVPDAKNGPVVDFAPDTRDDTAPAVVVPDKAAPGPVVDFAPDADSEDGKTPVVVVPDAKNGPVVDFSQAQKEKDGQQGEIAMPNFGEAINIPGEKNPSRKSASKKGDALAIPKDASKSKDLSFLQGCWVSDTGMARSTDKARVVVEYCFNKKGQGQQIIHEVGGNGGMCKGKASAGFSGQNLRIKGEMITCPNGDMYNPSSVICTGQGKTTQCTGKQPSGIVWPARFRKQ